MFTLISLAQYQRNLIQALFIHNLSFVYALSLFEQNRMKKNGNFERLRGVEFYYYSNKGGWGLLASLKVYLFEYIILSIHFELLMMTVQSPQKPRAYICCVSNQNNSGLTCS